MSPTEATPAIAPPSADPLPLPRPLPRFRRLADPRLALALILAAGLLLRVIWLAVPDRAVIFDEVYYVNAARVILGLPVDDRYVGQQRGIDPNREHPPLGKVLIAGGIRLFGEDAYGWRAASILAGLASILLLYGIVRAAGGDPWLGVLAAGLFGADNLAFVNSRVGTLDMPMTALMLLAAWLALRRRPLQAGIACAAAALIKLSGVLALPAILLLFAAGMWHRQGSRQELLRSSGIFLLGFVPFWLGGLWLLDLWVTPFRLPWDHLGYMLRHGLDLTHYIGASDPTSYPWQWLANERQINYFTLTSTAHSNGQAINSTQIFFRGAMNPLIVGAAPLAVAYSAWRFVRLGDRLSLWVATWIVATYLPWFVLVLLAHRITYIYYFLPSLPAVTVALAQLLRQAGLPRVVMWAYLVAVGVGFIDYFPYRSIP